MNPDQIFETALARGAAMRRRRRQLVAASGVTTALAAAALIAVLVVPSSGQRQSVDVLGGGTGPSAPSGVATTPFIPTTTGSTAEPVSVPGSITSTTLPVSGTLSSYLLVPLQVPNERGEWLSPSGSISCEVSYHASTNAQDETYCQETTSPQSSVVISDAGVITRNCSGDSGNCIGNPGVGTPILPYGSATGAGPIVCVSLDNGMVCKGSSGAGFLINRSGVLACTGSATGSATLTVCPAKGAGGTTVTIVGSGCAATSLTFGRPGSGSTVGTRIDVAQGAGNSFAGTWTVPTGVPPGSYYLYTTDSSSCSTGITITG